jgi:putative SOS response-associated peptidase YedK
MCGRYSLFTPPEEFEDRFDVTVETYEPRYNAAPGQSLPVITDRDETTVTGMEWGLVPSWADERDGQINARGETVHEKPTFREAFARSEGDLAAGRCLVPADGFYEWVEEGGTSQPYRVRLTGDRPFAMAGLWSQWRPETTQTGLSAFGGGDGPAAEPDIVETFTVVTTEPNSVVGDLHHRMAVILPPEDEQRWLSADPGEAQDLLDPYPGAEMEAYPVSPAVGDPANDSPALVEPLDGGV